MTSLADVGPLRGHLLLALWLCTILETCFWYQF